MLQRGPEGDPAPPRPPASPVTRRPPAAPPAYDAVVIAGRHLGSAAADDPPYCGSGGYPAEPIVSFCIGHGGLHVLFNKMPPQYAAYDPALEPAIGDLGERIDVSEVFDGWGYVRLFDPATMKNLDTFAVAETKAEANAVGAGDLSVHEVDPDLFENDLMHLSYYAAGTAPYASCR